MSLFAGLFSRRSDASVVQSASRDIRRLLGSTGGWFHEYADTSFFLGKLDFGAFADSGWHAGPEVIAVAGDPLYTHGRGLPRADTLRSLTHADGESDDPVLRGARGSFAFCRYEPAHRRLTLGTDRIGVRPVYVYANDEVVVFATALHILESIRVVPRQLSMRGVIELAVFDCTLGTRTPFAGIERMHAADLWSFDAAHASRTQYWRWDALPRTAAGTTEIAQRAYEQFMEGVTLRLGDSREETAYLSGGLDSRCVVAALRSLGARVDSHTFAEPGTKDLVFAAEFATAAAVGNHQHGLPEGKPDWSGMMRAATAADGGGAEARVRRAWSGDGGSVGVGHVPISPGIVAHMRSGASRAACRLYLREEQKRVPERLFASSVMGNEDLLLDGMEEELARVPMAEPGRRFHLFLLLNDQRHHLWRHFEGLLEHRLELVTPFFDSDFLATVLTADIDDSLGHRFYYAWMDCFDAVVRTVPWQSYPGHLPCPLVVEQRVQDQWDASFARIRRQKARRKLLRQGARIVLAPRFPRDVLRRTAFASAVLATALRIRNYEYAIESAILVTDYWHRAGRSVAPQ